ncbi:MAG: hypothetical protein ABW133_10630 [Polyangiaceae bacterium]
MKTLRCSVTRLSYLALGALVGSLLPAGCGNGDDAPPNNPGQDGGVDAGTIDDASPTPDTQNPPNDAAGSKSARGRIAAGREFSCALDETGAIVCWGPMGSVNRPPAGTGHTWIAAGGIEACAIKSDGEIVCWDMARAAEGAVVRNVPAGPFVEVAIGARPSGEYACGQRASGELACWRSANLMQRPELTMPASNPPFGRFDLGANAACGVRLDGTLSCWGTSSTPVTMNVPSGQFVDVVANEFHGCAVDTNGRPKCWGPNSYFAENFPQGARAVQLEGSSYADITCALLASGSVYCSRQSDTYPAPSNNVGITEISVAEDHYCFVMSDRSVGCRTDGTSTSHAPPATLRVPAK